MSPVSVIFCQMEVSATVRSLVLWSSTVYVCVCVCVCDLETSTIRRPSPPEGLDTKMDCLTDRMP